MTGTASGRRGFRLRRAALCMTIGTALAAATAACGTAAQAGPAGRTAVSAQPETISEAGSSLLYPLMGTWASAYQRQTPGVSVKTTSTSSGKGIAAASAGSVDLGASDAYLSSGDVVKTPALVNIPLAIAAQTVIYNLPDVSAADHVRLDAAVLAGIYEGTITTWDDPRIAAINPGASLPADKIVPVYRADMSGDTFLFTGYLSTGSQSAPGTQWNSKVGYGTTVAWPHVPEIGRAHV